jgi:disulfide bond formation protein DsbB
MTLEPVSVPNAAIEDVFMRVLFAIWLISLTATLGSLFFSEVMRLPPCVLCWYQRIFMYPLVVVTTVGLLLRDPGALRHAWPLAVGGFAVAVYHNLLYYHLIPESITPCTTGVSCTDRQIEWLGFITIPLLSLGAFTLIVATLLVGQHLRGRIDEDQ